MDVCGGTPRAAPVCAAWGGARARPARECRARRRSTRHTRCGRVRSSVTKEMCRVRGADALLKRQPPGAPATPGSGH
eukprot:255005-Prymnesium_polylepis.1